MNSQVENVEQYGSRYEKGQGEPPRKVTFTYQQI